MNEKGGHFVRQSEMQGGQQLQKKCIDMGKEIQWCISALNYGSGNWWSMH